MRAKKHLVPIALSLPALFLIVLPLLGLFLNAEIARFGSYVCCAQVVDALRLTLMTSAISAVLILVIGTPLAYWLAYADFRGKRVVDTLVDLPLVLPPAVAGVALLMTLGRSGFIGVHLAPNITLPFTTAAVVIAQTFVAGPFYIRQARVGFESVPRQLQMASLTLGASPLRTFFRLTAPLASHAILARQVMAWSREVGEW